MKSATTFTAVLAIAGSAVARNYEEKLHTGPAPASLSAFFASQSAFPPPSSVASVPAGVPTTAAVASPATSVVAASVVATSGVATSVVATGSAPAASASSSAAPSTGENCVTFTSDDPSWYYSNSYPWTGSGTFGDLPGGKICLPSNSAGGAMYIGSSANPGAGNTKFECYFPTDSTQQSNCDVSLVDGYSLSVTCTMEGASQPQIGGDVDLWTSGTCPGGNQGGKCLNTKAYDAAQTDVDPFFQNGLTSPNNYCIWWACTQDSFFNTGTEIKCHVSAGTPAASKRDVGGRIHARSLEQIVGA